MKTTRFEVVVFFFALSALSANGADGPLAFQPSTPVQLFPLSDVRLLPSPFAEAVGANREYLLDLDPDRLLAPFLREAGLQLKKEPYPNWESSGLDGHTAGHYLSALSQMIASGNDPDGELGRRLDYMLSEMARVQQANGDGYIGGISGSRDFWEVIAAGDVDKIWDRWVPWYNVHKTFAGLRDAYIAGGRPKARELLVQLGDWCVNLTSRLDDAQMQQMLGNEYGGMNEVMADIYTITGDRKYLETAQRFNHHAVIDPLMNGQDRLTGLHANTQIPKITGLEEIATLTGNPKEEFGARFFWDTVTKNRSTAFGGNSVSEHFNDPKDFSGMLNHREGPETCNTYNMLRLTEKLFSTKPEARYADYYERAPLQPHPVVDRSHESRLRLLHADPSEALSRLFAAREEFLVLRRHGHGEPRPLRPVHLRSGKGWHLRQFVHLVRAESRRWYLTGAGKQIPLRAAHPAYSEARQTCDICPAHPPPLVGAGRQNGHPCERSAGRQRFQNLDLRRGAPHVAEWRQDRGGAAHAYFGRTVARRL